MNKNSFFFGGDCKDRFRYLVSMLIASFILAFIAISTSLIICLYNSSSYQIWKFAMTSVYTLLSISIFLFVAIMVSDISKRKVRNPLLFAGLFFAVLVSAGVFIAFHLTVYLHNLSEINAEVSVAWNYVNADPYVVIFALLLLVFDIFVIVKLGTISKKEENKKVEE